MYGLALPRYSTIGGVTSGAIVPGDPISDADDRNAPLTPTALSVVTARSDSAALSNEMSVVDTPKLTPVTERSAPGCEQVDGVAARAETRRRCRRRCRWRIRRGMCRRTTLRRTPQPWRRRPR